ncbi:tripartite tricarboxylate transporter permease [Chloroflexota bacterium]
MGYFEALWQGFLLLMDPTRFAFLFLGVLLGMTLGAIPGLGGTIGLAILLPFVFGMEPTFAIALLIGMMAITTTSDSIPAIMFSVPGTASAAVDLVDGYPMTKRGEASRALGAAFSASMTGGIFGAIVLSASIPIIRPLLRQWMSPEFFMLCILGVVTVGALSGRRPLKGILAGGFGLALATVGIAPAVGHFRFSLGQPYLFDGIHILVVALGIFAMPELVDLFMKGSKIADVPKLGHGVLQGYKDTYKNWWLVLRSSAIGAWMGFLPGVGASAGSWIAYGHAVMTEKNGQFGNGDVRGLIAPEASNNAVRGGELIPTLMFGVPGSAPMAIFLTGLIILGVGIGPQLIERQLPLVFSMAWGIALANIMSTAVCSLLIRPIAALSMVRIHLLAPFILLFVLVGVYQATYNWGDFVGLFLFGLGGWTMKRLGWPRPPLLIGFVLGGLAERYLWLSHGLFGWSFLYRPWVLIIFGMIICSLVYFMYNKKQRDYLGE